MGVLSLRDATCPVASARSHLGHAHTTLDLLVVPPSVAASQWLIRCALLVQDCGVSAIAGYWPHTSQPCSQTLTGTLPDIYTLTMVARGHCRVQKRQSIWVLLIPVADDSSI